MRELPLRFLRYLEHGIEGAYNLFAKHVQWTCVCNKATSVWDIEK